MNSRFASVALMALLYAQALLGLGALGALMVKNSADGGIALAATSDLNTPS